VLTKQASQMCHNNEVLREELYLLITNISQDCVRPTYNYQIEQNSFVAINRKYVN